MVDPKPTGFKHGFKHVIIMVAMFTNIENIVFNNTNK